MTKLERVKRSLDAIENCRYSEFSIFECCDYIAWLARWNKVPRSEWEPLCERAIKILDKEYTIL